MNRTLSRLLLWLLLVPLLVILAIPFSATGSRWLLEAADRMLPLDITYGGGALAGRLQLERIAWQDADLALELRDVALQLAPGCLWRSELCFQELHVGHMELHVIPGTAEETATEPQDDAQIEFPVVLRTRNLQLDSLLVTWEGGQWQQGRITASVRIAGSTISVQRALVEDARLTQAGTDDSGTADTGTATSLPEIDLPLVLEVAELVLENAAWDLYGQTGQVNTLHLQGRWQGTALRVDTLELRSPPLGDWDADGDIAFRADWPLHVAVRGRLPELPDWPAVLGRDLALSAGGDLSAIALEAELAGDVTIDARATVNALDPALAFGVTASARWTADLPLDRFVELPGALQGTALTTPLQIYANGDVDAQAFQLSANASAPGYPGLALELAGGHRQGSLTVDDLRLRDAAGTNSVWAEGSLGYNEGLDWSARLDIERVELPPAAGPGEFAGHLDLAGSAAGDAWELRASDVAIRGTVQGLPASLEGYAGIDGQLHLLPSELHGDLRGTSLTLLASPDTGQSARLDLVIADLGSWLEGGRGSVSLHGTVAPGWDALAVSGRVNDLHWQDLSVAAAKLGGNYRRTGGSPFTLRLDLEDLVVGEFNLDTLALSAEGDSTRQSASLHTRGDVAAVLAVDGGFDEAGHWAGRLQPTTLQTREGNWYLSEPVALDYSPDPASLQVAAHCWQFQATRICPGAARLGVQGAASIDVDGDLAALAAFLPEYLELRGRLEAAVDARWAPDQPLVLAGEGHVQDIVFVRHYGAGADGVVKWQRMDATLRNGPGGLEAEAALYDDATPLMRLTFDLPPDRSQRLSGRLEIDRLQLASLAPFAPDLAALEGELGGTLDIQGSVDQPLATGELHLGGARVVMLDNPTELSQLNLTLSALGDHALIRGDGLLGGGRLQLEGRLTRAPAWQLQLQVSGDQQAIVVPPYTEMVLSEQLALDISADLLDLRGDIVVHRGTLEHEQLPEGSVGLSDDVVEVDLSGNVIRESSPFGIGMNLALVIENHFKIVGDNVDATVGGDLQIRQQPGRPLQVFGNLNVVGGELRAYQQRLRIQRGTVSFSGTPDNPELDVSAQREISNSDVVVGLQLQGTLTQPQLDIFSEPVMSQAEAMSYLVRGRGLDTGAGSDGVAMALSVGTGIVNQSALVSEINRIPFINNLAFGAEGTTEADTAATVGGYIGERLYLSYGMGIYEPINVLTARLYLQTRLWLEVVSRLENSVDLYYSFDID